MRLIRRLYDWVLHWAETPYGGPALFLAVMSEALALDGSETVLEIGTGSGYQAAVLAFARRSGFFPGADTVSGT